MRSVAVRKATSLLIALGCVAVCSVDARKADAQYVGYRYNGGLGYIGNPMYNYGFYSGGTAYGSMATGMGNLIAAQGAYNQATAQAAQEAQKAYSMSLDNRLKAAQTMDELQQMNRRQAAEKKQRESEIWAKNVPPPKRPTLTSSQLDPVTGEINWNHLLLAPEFASYRDKLQVLFTKRAQDSSSVSYYDVSMVTGPMRDLLDTKIAEYPTNDFFAARHFIDSIGWTSRYSSLEPAPADQTSHSGPPAANVPKS